MHANIDVHIRRLIAEFPGYRVKCIEKIQQHFANMNSAEKVGMTGFFNKSNIKEGETAMNYIKRFQNAHALSVLVGNNYSEYKLMHILLDNFHQCGTYSAQIDSHQEELRREENFTDQKYLSISSLQTNYISLDSS